MNFCYQTGHENGSPVIKAWHVLRLQMEEQPAILGVVVNILNKQSQTADKGWSSNLGLDEVLTIPHRKTWPCYETDTTASGMD
jgi:hypothetical protein